MKIIQYLKYLDELKPNVFEAFIKGIRFGLYIGLIISCILFYILKLSLK